MNKKEERVEESKEEEKQPKVTIRRVVIETDGANLSIVENQLSVLELREVGRQLITIGLKNDQRN
jgi:DNA repair ATPase RecN